VRYLLDTHALLWWLNGHADLSLPARSIIEDRQNTIYVSAASAWEIAIKFRKGKLPSAAAILPDFVAILRDEGFVELPITSAHSVRSALLPGEHWDPFDRIIAAQAMIEDLALISRDDKMPSLGVVTHW
jgi:PIN domain nuclease of toxin-antitoxin system